jgi:hypothetical protein
MGLTSMAIEYQKDPRPEVRSSMVKYLVNQWFLGSGNICGVSYDINALAHRFYIDPMYIKEFMRDGLVNSKIWDHDNQEQILNGLLGEQLSWALEDRMEIVQQVNLLKLSQGGKYTPFITAELNKALKLRLDSSASLQNLIRSMVGGNTTNIFAQFNNQNNANQTGGISIEEARELIQESQKQLPKDSSLKLLETQYDLQSLPVVVATKQIGVDTAKEGLNFNKAEISAVVDDYKGAIEVSDHEHHELRREIEQQIDPDAFDPELEIYEEEEEEPTDPLSNRISEFLNS